MKQNRLILMTPGPLTTSVKVKQAMSVDLGSRDQEFTKMNKFILKELLLLANASSQYACVPVPGSGTYAIEASIATLVNKGKVLVLINGAYGERIAHICKLLKIPYETLYSPENMPFNIEALKQKLCTGPEFKYIFIVHCETTSGVLNPLPEISDIAAQNNIHLFIDAMSSFGAIPSLNLKKIHADVIIASANKCLQAMPGLAFVIARKKLLEQSKNKAKTLSLDLERQFNFMQENDFQYRFTPPIQVIAALKEAIIQLKQEGGIKARFQRYVKNCEKLRQYMTEMGFLTYLKDSYQAPIIVTFLMPKHENFSFPLFYQELKKNNFIIYPGKLTKTQSFRIGCIGDIDSDDIKEFCAIAKEILKTKNISAPLY